MVNKPFSISFFMLTAEELLGKKAQRSEPPTSRLQCQPFQISVILICKCEQKDFRPGRVLVSSHHASARTFSWSFPFVHLWLQK